MEIGSVETGSRLGPYEVREKIGEGGMATVYKVWHTGLHRFEALKLPRHQSSSDSQPEFVQRLLAEARTAAQLHHPHIVAIHNVSDANAALHFFTMDLVSGYDLSVLLKQRGRLRIEEVLPILRQVAEALDYAHAHGVIHRDIKPANILLQEASAPGGWVAKVVDFGISRAAEDTEGTKLTKSGMIVGTPEYMSAEQSGSGQPVDYRTDIYSLGVVAYEMLCGRAPFLAGEGVSRMSVLMAHIHDIPKPLREHIPDVPMAANNAVLKALAKHPAQRFDSCADFMKALSGAVTVAPPWAQDTVIASPAGAATLNSPRASSPTPPEPVVTDPPFKPAPQPAPIERKPTSRSRLPLLGLGALLGVGAITWAVVQRGSTPPGNEGTVSAPATIAPTPVAPTPVVARPTPRPRAAVVPPRATPAATAQSRYTIPIRRIDRIPFPTQTRRTAALLSGQSRIQQYGRSGAKEVTVEAMMQGRRELSRRIVSSRVIKQPVPQIRLVGTRAKAPPRSTRKATPRRVVPERVAPKRVKTRKPVRPPRRTRRTREAPPPKIDL